jgi:DNA-binding transcriptional ArsR family regulator
MPGGRLTGQDRRHIAESLAEGLGYAEIGRRLGRPASTIMREVTRNGGPEGYAADRAQEATLHRARRDGRPRAAAPPVADGGHGRDPGAVEDFTRSFADLLIQQGMPRMAARVMACLYVTDSGSLTAAELVERLRVSPASVSHAVTFLEEQGMLRRERVAGARRERYVADDEVWLRTILASVRTNDELMATTRHGSEVLGGATPAGARFEVATELLALVSEGLRWAMREWRREQEAREAGR